MDNAEKINEKRAAAAERARRYRARQRSPEPTEVEALQARVAALEEQVLDLVRRLPAPRPTGTMDRPLVAGARAQAPSAPPSFL